MVKEQLNSLIMEAMKAGDKTRTEALRAIKTAFINWETAKENVGKELNEEAEIRILKKLVDQRMESHHIYHEAGRYELAGEELAQADVINDFLPQPASEEAIINAFRKAVDGGLTPEKKNMGLFIKTIKGYLPNADGKTVAQIVQTHLS